MDANLVKILIFAVVVAAIATLIGMGVQFVINYWVEILIFGAIIFGLWMFKQKYQQKQNKV